MAEIFKIMVRPPNDGILHSKNGLTFLLKYMATRFPNKPHFLALLFREALLIEA